MKGSFGVLITKNQEASQGSYDKAHFFSSLLDFCQFNLERIVGEYSRLF
jgi:hypothetical protein